MSSNLLPTNGPTCPSCQEPVVPGHPRCGRCRALLPAALRATARSATIHSFKSSMYSGGTSVAPAPRRWRMWAAALAAGLLGAIVGVVLLGGDRSSGEGPEELPEPAAARSAPAASGAASSLQGGSGRSGSGQALEQAARELGRALKKERLWSTVTIDRANPSVLIIRSSLCEEQSLRSLIAGVREGLRSKGAAAVRCLAPHGGIVFEEAL